MPNHPQHQPTTRVRTCHKGLAVRVGPSVLAALAAFAHGASAQTPAVVPGVTPAPASEPTPAPAPAPAPTPAPTPTQVDPRVGAALDRIEAADRELRTLTAAVRLIRRFPQILGGGQQTQYGTIAFSAEPGPGPGTAAGANAGAAQGQAGAPSQRRFAIEFETRDIPDPSGQVRREDDPQDFIFDGTWLLERRHKDKFFARRRMLAPGAGRDPLKIGEGPFPLPIGQRKDDMLARFAVSLVPALEGSPDNARLRELLKDCTQLRLVPRVEVLGAKDFREIRLWFREPDALPIFAQTTNRDDSTAEVFLVNIKRNEPVAPATFDTTPPAPSEGWTGDVIEQVPQGQP